MKILIVEDEKLLADSIRTLLQKKGFDVEVAYELNDTTTDIEVEVKELFSFSDKTITKTFSIK